MKKKETPIRQKYPFLETIQLKSSALNSILNTFNGLDLVVRSRGIIGDFSLTRFQIIFNQNVLLHYS